MPKIIPIKGCRTCPLAHRNPVKILQVPLQFLCMVAAGTDHPGANVSDYANAEGRPGWCPMVGEEIVLVGGSGEEVQETPEA